MQIRPLQPPDAAAYRAFRLRGLRDHPDAFTSSAEEIERQPLAVTEQRLAGGPTALWAAFVDGRIAGAIGLERESRLKARHKATLVAMFVAAEYGGRGIGRALVDTAIAAARDNGIELLVLTVTDTNQAAHRLYAQAGFQDIGTEPDAIRVGGVSYGKCHMYLSLVPPPAGHLAGSAYNGEDTRASSPRPGRRKDTAIDIALDGRTDIDLDTGRDGEGGTL